jgi:hypothetical protein
VDLLGSQPTEGNIRGGLTTIEEKALGNIQKTGTRPVRKVLRPAEPVGPGEGLVFMDSSSAAAEMITLAVAGGSVLHFFTTGQGNVVGHPLVPVIKISPNPKTCETMAEHVDVPLPDLLVGEIGLDEAASSLARGLPRAAQGEDRLALGGFELAGKTLGLVGLGEVGLRVAHRAKTLGMRVVGYDPLRRPWEAALEVAGVEFLPLEEVLAEAQFLSLHAPLTPETRGLVGREVLARMRPGAYLINTARGELVDHHALYEALRSGHLAGAVLDVTDPEPLPPDHPLRELENCLLTPHIAGLTRESQARVGERVVRGILEVLRAA